MIFSNKTYKKNINLNLKKMIFKNKKKAFQRIDLEIAIYI